MQNRFTRVVLICLLVVLAAYVALPYIDRIIVPPTPHLVAARGDLAEIERATIAIFQRASPSVVQVVGRTGAVGASELEPEEGGVQTGTGFVWDAAGHVVTNNHVVQSTSELVVRLAGGKMVPARLVGAAPSYDLAVIHLEGAVQLPPSLAVGTSADLQVGQSAFAIGNPYGLDQSLTTGVISALKRRLPTSAGREVANVIQTDAAIN
ncbi:MAG: trypsin-like peptidase domain-containing protein, partial [Acetobacteraceae bacterium]|nr:trypsin-like peptidase domain-containing protein [Acetobacteraceae bacterium]